MPQIVVGAIIGGVVSGVTAACMGGTLRQIGAAAAGGAVTGALAAATCGASLLATSYGGAIAVTVASSSLASVEGYLVEKMLLGQSPTLEGAIDTAVSGAAGAMLGTLLGRAVAAFSSKAAQINYIRHMSVHNEGASGIMLGKYDGGGPTSYITKAGTEYEYFSLGDEWDAIKAQYGYSDKDMFKKFNIPFLDKGIKAGKTFHFSHNPVGDTGALGNEYKYLMNHRYKFDSETFTATPRR